MQITSAIAQQLESYTRQHPEEVLLLTIKDAGVGDEIMIFKGFSSSLMQPTDFNPDNPLFSEKAEFVSLDRIESPYIPNAPIYIEKDLPWEKVAQLLADS